MKFVSKFLAIAKILVTYALIFVVLSVVWLLIGVAPLVVVSSKNTTLNNYLERALDVVKSPCKYREYLSYSGTLGDTFGFVNSLFSGLAFAGLAIAILYQRKQQIDQREELSLTKQELSNSAVAQIRTSRNQAITSYLAAATALAESYGRSISIVQGVAAHEGRQAGRQIESEFQLRKYRQMQEILLFEISNIDQYLDEDRPVLNVKTKLDFFRRQVGDYADKCHQLMLRPRSDRDEFPLKSEAVQLLSFVHQECVVFLQQDGVSDSRVGSDLGTRLSMLKTVLDGQGSEKFEAFVNRSHNAIHSLLISWS